MRGSLFFAIIFSGTLFLLSSCEDVIDIPLKTADSKVVIEGKVTNEPGGCVVSLTRIVAYNQTNYFPPVTNAQVILKDDNGMAMTLPETTPGVYSNPLFTGVGGRTYTLEIQDGNEVYTAVSKMSAPVPIDSVQLLAQPGFFGLDTVVTSAVFFNDPPGIENYYRLVYSLRDTAFDTYLLTDDAFFDGQTASAGTPPFFREPLSGDSVQYDLWSIDRPVYKYFLTLSEIVGGTSGQEAAPANPADNIEGNAIGYFSAVSISRLGFRLP